MRTLIVSAVFSILGMVAASQAQDIGDVQQGRQVALMFAPRVTSCAPAKPNLLSPRPHLRGDHPHAMDDGSGPRGLVHRPITSDHAELHLFAATGSRSVGLHSEPPGLTRDAYRKRRGIYTRSGDV